MIKLRETLGRVRSLSVKRDDDTSSETMITLTMLLFVLSSYSTITQQYNQNS